MIDKFQNVNLQEKEGTEIRIYKTRGEEVKIPNDFDEVMVIGGVEHVGEWEKILN